MTDVYTIRSKTQHDSCIAMSKGLNLNKFRFHDCILLSIRRGKFDETLQKSYKLVQIVPLDDYRSYAYILCLNINWYDWVTTFLNFLRTISERDGVPLDYNCHIKITNTLAIPLYLDGTQTSFTSCTPISDKLEICLHIDLACAPL